MKIIFTGANYWQVNDLPKEIKGDYAMVKGYRWIKSQKRFSKKYGMFAYSPNCQAVLTNEEAKAQGLM